MRGDDGRRYPVSGGDRLSAGGTTGIAVGPSSLAIDNALRGSFERSLTIFNPSDTGFDVV